MKTESASESDGEHLVTDSIKDQRSINKMFSQMDFLTTLRSEVQINEFYAAAEMT